MPRILIAGFDAFGDLVTNPSAELVMKLERIVPDTSALILPTSYKRASARLVEELRRMRPTYCIMFGYARRAFWPALEQYARNHDGGGKTDNDGDSRSAVIDAEAPALLASRVDIEKLYRLLEERGCKVSTSEDAGDYVCNHTYFRVLAHLQRSGNTLPYLLIHIPGPELSPETVESGRAALELMDHVV